MERYVDTLFRYAERLEPQHWALVLGGLVIVGFLCLRGFGSRSQY